MEIEQLKNKIKVVFFDIDDTLYVKHKNKIPSTIPLIFRRLKENGIIPAIATGRTRCGFPLELDRILKQENVDLFITMNGQYVEYQNNVIADYPIPSADILRMIDFFQTQNIHYAFINNRAIRLSELNHQIHTALDPITLNYDIDKTYYQTHTVYQMLAFYDETVDSAVEKSGVLGTLKYVRWHPLSVDIFDGQGSKARGISQALAHFGWTMENVMAFGDGLNDIEMLTQAGVGVAVGGAHEKLKAVADYVCDEIENDGIYQFLRQAELI